ncbi:MAG: hypothetical protein ACREHG_07185 [Candidatus Saccharimonadales bacterium]
MNIELLSQSIRSAGLFPVRVELTHDQDEDMRVSGSLEDYLAAVKALQSPVIFIGTFELTERYFIYEADDNRLGEDEDDDGEEMDLRTIQPKLKSYSSRIGETGWFQLAAPMANGSLTFSIEEEWWTQFYEILDAAKESVQEDRSAAQEEVEAEEERQKDVARKKLQNFINNEDFRRLKTQKAMREYAIDKYPELAEWDNFELKEEIQNLAARIEAKGLGRK